MTPLAEALSNAEALIAEYGHAKGDFGSRLSGFCLAGAIREVSSEYDACYYDALNGNLVSLPGMECVRLVIGMDSSIKWNDASTAEDVRAALLDAASLAMDGAE